MDAKWIGQVNAPRAVRLMNDTNERHFAPFLASLSHPLSMGVPADSAMTSLDKDAVIKSVDMTEDMKYQAVEVAKEVRHRGGAHVSIQPIQRRALVLGTYRTDSRERRGGTYQEAF